MKKKKKEKKILYQLIFSAFLLFSNAYLVKANSDILSQDSTGKYCINTCLLYTSDAADEL